MLRPQITNAARVAGRRANSTQANPQVQKAVQQASQLYNQGAQTVKRVAGPVGDRVGSLLGAYRAPLTYNWNVFTSLVRQVYKAEKLAPPTHLSQWATAYANIWARASSPAWWRSALESGEWAKVAIAAVEAYGIFKIGEIIGRRHLVGYKIKEPAAAAH
ncbi:hypothetical protein Q8F55_008711 [Vanrija albida]|uniref:ATP synthase subunit n=1 Tax=Vanrija albida TaxID=181172 RepID=A0ABR3PRL4_9TREE